MKRLLAVAALLVSAIVCAPVPSASASDTNPQFFGYITTKTAGTNTLCHAGYKKRFVIIGTIQSTKTFTTLHNFNLYVYDGGADYAVGSKPQKLNAYTVRYVFYVHNNILAQTNRSSWTYFQATPGAGWHAGLRGRHQVCVSPFGSFSGEKLCNKPQDVLEVYLGSNPKRNTR